MQLDNRDNKSQSRRQKEDDDGEQLKGMPPTAGFMGHTFVGLKTKREQKVIKRVVNATLLDVPQWLD